MTPSPIVSPADKLPKDATPQEVASGLSYLRGFVWLDSSSAESVDDDHSSANQCAILAAEPRQILTGSIHDPADRQRLKDVIDRNEIIGADVGFPLGGLIGWVEYGGEFCFGEYHEMLVYDYISRQWSELGQLSSRYQPREVVPFTADIAFTDSIDAAGFCSGVEQAKAYIASGDIYQVNLSHRFSAPWQGSADDAQALYQRLRHVSPAPYSAYLDLADRTVLSASPELFLRISDRTIETRPIKGTRPRFSDREKDQKSAYDLITSSKEIAELVMITDLERNDLGQISEFGSVEATELLKLEPFAQVFHLVSTVQGTVREEVHHVDALAACFPGGSITGAPKKRSMEIIDEIESIPRGLYTGTVGCFGFNRESVFNIVIRTAIVEDEEIHFHVGAGIVADSEPEAEWQETLHKAAGLRRAAKI